MFISFVRYEMTITNNEKSHVKYTCIRLNNTMHSFVDHLIWPRRMGSLQKNSKTRCIFLCYDQYLYSPHTTRNKNHFNLISKLIS